MLLPDNVKVEFLPTMDYRTVMSWFRKGKQVHLGEDVKKSWWVQVLVRLRQTFPFSLLLGEGSLVYLASLLWNTRELLRGSSQTVLYTSYPPYADLFGAYVLKKLHPGITWVVDFRDLHIEPIYRNVYFPHWQAAWNRRMLGSAAMLTTVSKGLSKKLEKYNRPIYVLENGLRSPIRKEGKLYDRFTIAYTGSMFGDERDPTPLLLVLTDLIERGRLCREKIRIVYAGKDSQVFGDQIKQAGLESILEDRGLVSREEALMIQQRSHINLLLTTSSTDHKGVVTGKLYEYLAALRPIIMLIKGPHDPELQELFESVQAGHVHSSEHGDVLQLESAVEAAYQDYLRGEATYLNRSIIEQRFSWERSISELLQVLETI